MCEPECEREGGVTGQKRPMTADRAISVTALVLNAGRAVIELLRWLGESR